MTRENTPTNPDPYAALASNIIVQAAKDIHAPNFLLALDAFLWWLEDGKNWLEDLDIDCELPLERILQDER